MSNSAKENPELLVVRDFAQRLTQLFASAGPPAPSPTPDPKGPKDTKDQGDAQKDNKDNKDLGDKSVQDKSLQDMQLTMSLASLTTRQALPTYGSGARFSSPVDPSLRPTLAPNALRDEPDLTSEQTKQLVEDFKALLADASQKLSQL